MIECTWCGTRYASFQPRCESCGGPLPPPPGQDAGEPPPPPPRSLPAAFERRVRYSHNVEFMIGAIFTAIGALIGVVFVAVGISAPLLPMAGVGGLVLLIFGGVGLLLLRVGLRRAASTLRAYREGRAVVGEIVDVHVDTSVKINGRSPWAITYTFKAGGAEHVGTARTFDPRARQRSPGQPVHVLHVDGDPEHSTLYPPMR